MKEFEILKNNALYIKTLEIIYKKIGVNKFKIINNSEQLIAFKFICSESYSFEIVFWLNENRISFNIEDWYEVTDCYIENEKEAIGIYEFIETVFKNKLVIEEYSTEKSNKIYKRNLIFTTKINGNIEKINIIKRLSFRLPWTKEKLINSNEFRPLY